jgi:hypothetical protein
MKPKLMSSEKKRQTCIVQGGSSCAVVAVAFAGAMNYSTMSARLKSFSSEKEDLQISIPDPTKDTVITVLADVGRGGGAYQLENPTNLVETPNHWSQYKQDSCVDD